MLLAYKADVNLKEFDDNTALIKVTQKRFYNDERKAQLNQVAQQLIDAGTYIHLQNSNGYTALLYAALNGHVNIASLLLKRGASVNSKNSGGDTALMIAGESDNMEIAQLLLQKGADPNIPNRKNKTILERICTDTSWPQALNRSLVTLLLQHKAAYDDFQRMLDPERLRILLKCQAEADQPEALATGLCVDHGKRNTLLAVTMAQLLNSHALLTKPNDPRDL